MIVQITSGLCELQKTEQPDNDSIISMQAALKRAESTSIPDSLLGDCKAVVDAASQKVTEISRARKKALKARLGLCLDPLKKLLGLSDGVDPSKVVWYKALKEGASLTACANLRREADFKEALQVCAAQCVSLKTLACRIPRNSA